ncbi:ergothioneine biosynthesis protein EgtB [Actimicrobium sp. CCI2.3]|nr:ergothioneine biosynthesis protein EgtB [Actimicrobium sp. CCI2.3]MDY7574105.1 ergothioneine biosynthesis protein EgtB [Actimicrobium sp. CCI2.3]MEB0023235.1 ergothioneine biosynthesis protein EgtB [Actimicrobium sp. CCI2.3]
MRWQLATDFVLTRERTVALAAPLSVEDACVQSMPDASPVKWHLAHTTWFFETFILERFEAGFQPHHRAFRVLFNSYYNGVGEKHARAQRGMITRPSLAEVLAYRAAVDARIMALLETASPELAALIRLGVQHEQQHQELLLTDLKHLLSLNPLSPVYAHDATLPSVRHSLPGWHRIEAGIVEIGVDDEGFCFDNERPRHRQFVESFALATTLVSNGDYLAFIDAGGYGDAALWLSEGWDWVCNNALTQPLYWRRDAAGRQEFTLRGLQPLDLQRPVIHLSYFEADAYARWAGARLPTEAQWESAVLSASPGTFDDLFGACWQWTSSSYAPYPGFAAADGALGEYNGKFMVNQYVLRGGSCATPDGHTRATYRNFFPATARWQFTGIRLAQ